MAELVAGVELYLKGWQPAGKRLVAVSSSGATCVMAADAASMIGMPLAELQASTTAELAQILPGFATTTNPVDLTGALLTNSRCSGIAAILPRDPPRMILLGFPVTGAGYDIDLFARMRRSSRDRQAGRHRGAAARCFRPLPRAGSAGFTIETQAGGALPVHAAFDPSPAPDDEARGAGGKPADGMVNTDGSAHVNEAASSLSWPRRLARGSASIVPVGE